MEIYSEKLREELKKRNLKANHASEEIGRNPNYIAGCLNRGAIGNSEAIALEYLFHINRSNICKETDKTTERTIESDSVDFNQHFIIIETLLSKLVDIWTDEKGE